MSKTEKFECICGGKHGRLHKPPCEHEECPFCHEQLMFCDCCYILLKIDPDSQELNKRQETEWNKLLRQKGLIRVGSGVMYRADKNWTDTKRKEVIAAIATEMSCDQNPDTARIKCWSERLTALTKATSVFLEMNQGHILRGDPVEWNPPSK